MAIEPTVVFEHIDPLTAAAYLTTNVKNRPFRQNHVDALARDMREGRYAFNGDAIRFDLSGILLDGQHRLMAIAQSGTTQKMLVIRDLPEETMKTIDAGVKRTTGDRFNMSGHKNSTSLAATLNIMTGLAAGYEKKPLTSSEAFELLEKHPRVEDSVALVNSIRIIGTSYLAAIHYIGHATGYGRRADEFVNVIRTGIAEHEHDPAFSLREKMIRLRGTRRTPTRTEQLENLTAAWENKRLGRPLAKVVPRSGERRLHVHGWTEQLLLAGFA